MNSIPNSILTLLAGIVLTLISLWYGQNHGLLPIAASEEAVVIDGLFNTMMTIGMGLFLMVQIILIYSAIRFRQRKGETGDGSPVEGNVPLEILWTAIPAIIVFGISVYSFNVYADMGGLSTVEKPMLNQPDQGVEVAYDPNGVAVTPLLLNGTSPASADAVTQIAGAGVGASPKRVGKSPDVSVNVTALQFAFIFNYPDSGITSGDLHVPLGREVQLKITAQDVIHAVWLPEFRLKQDAVPGQETELRFEPSKLGTYPVICAELCGPYHGAMKSQIIVQTPEDYDAWIQEQVASAGDAGKTVAMQGGDRTDGEFLQPFVHEMEMTVSPNTLAQLQPHPHHAHH